MSTNSAPPRLSVVNTLLTLVAMAVGVAAYLALYAVLGLHEAYIGFLFLFWWATFQKFELAVLPATAVGSFAGLALGFALQQLSLRFGLPGAALFGGLTVVVLFLLLRQQLRLLINHATMLMLTVGAIPHLQAHADFGDLFASLAVAVALSGGLVWLVGRLRAGAFRRGAAEAPQVQA